MSERISFPGPEIQKEYLKKFRRGGANGLQAAVDYVNLHSVLVKEQVGHTAISFRRIVIPGSDSR